MRLFLFLAACLGINPLYSQITDNFSDGNFHSNPSWTGDTSKYTVASEVLKLDAPASSDTAVLMLSSNMAIDAEWSIYISLDFNPSSSNYSKIYLISDVADLKKNVHGYFVKYGGSLDEISLYRQDGLKELKIIDGKDGRLNINTSNMRIKVTRDVSYKFTLFVDTIGDTNYIPEGHVLDSTYIHSKTFGIVCKYTSTRSDKFAFDDLFINGSNYTDKLKPRIMQEGMSNENTWSITFNETIDTARIKSSKIHLNAINSRYSTFLYDSSHHILELTFDQPFPHGKLIELSVDSIFDLAGNAVTGNLFHDVFNYEDSTRFKDIIFSEVMPDPEPSVALPATEYIELYNRSDAIIDLESWIICDERDSLQLPTYLIYPDNYLLIAEKSDSLLWKEFKLPIFFANMPSLNNDADHLTLIAFGNKKIDTLTYFGKQHSKEKLEGGWSLELVNPNFICNDSANWRSSKDPSGGSPGQANSVMDRSVEIDLSLNKIMRVTEREISLTFRGYPMPGSMIKDNFSSTPETSLQEIITGSEKALELTFEESLERNKSYTFSIEHVSDCYNRSENELTFSVIIPDELTSLNIIINEILFNPYPGGSDFVEIYNRSGHFLDLSQVSLTNSTSDTFTLASEYLILRPHEFMAFTEDTGHLISTYKSSVREHIRLSAIPSFSDKHGQAHLLDKDFNIIDAMTYDESMHFSLLESTEGVSLERISPASESAEREGWTSASESAGYATPGTINSQFIDTKPDHFYLEPGIFSPDNDGYNDVLSIHYKFNSPGNLGSISLYDHAGHLIRKLVSNQLLSSQGSFFWDGFKEDKKRAAVGYYLVLFEYINQSGQSKKEMATVVVANEFK